MNEHTEKYMPMEMGSSTGRVSVFEKPDFKAAFDASLNLRKCQNYNPAGNYIRTEKDGGKPYIGLGLDYKRTWLFQYAKEQGIEWTDILVETDDVTIQHFESASTAMAIAKARIYVAGKLIATGIGNSAFSTKEIASMDGAVQRASGNALARALTNAGFGTISYMDDLPLPGEKDGTVPSPTTAPPADNSDLPFTMPEEKDTPPVNTASADAPPPPTPAVDANDPIVQAKQMEVTYKPRNSGQQVTKTMGAVLATDPWQILTWADDSKFAPKTKKMQAIKAAAKLLEKEARLLLGK